MKVRVSLKRLRPIHTMVANSRARLSGCTHRPARQGKAAAAQMAMIRVAVIGAGQWGPNLIRNFHNKQTSEVVWIIDRDAARLEEVHAHFPDVQIAKDPEQALRDSSVHAVVGRHAHKHSLRPGKRGARATQACAGRKTVDDGSKAGPRTSRACHEIPADAHGRPRVRVQPRHTQGERISRCRASREGVLRVDGPYKSWTHSRGCERCVGPCGARSLHCQLLAQCRTTKCFRNGRNLDQSKGLKTRFSQLSNTRKACW